MDPPQAKRRLRANSAEDDKYSRRNRFDGPTSEFKEKEGYKPQPKLEYIDDNGKAMSTKEAFRHLSHKFHGKGSGKLKSEKRAKKQDEKMVILTQFYSHFSKFFHFVILL